jgi:hypothetical protein
MWSDRAAFSSRAHDRGATILTDRSAAEAAVEQEELRRRCARLYHALVAVIGQERAMAIARGEIG